MIRKIFFILLLFTAITASAQVNYVPSPENLKSREWFQDAKFGMFIHWGVYSILGDGEWVMNNQRIDKATYQKLPAFFNPVDYDPKAWVAMAKAAGMKYIVITSKHHDGFALHDSQTSDYDAGSVLGRDLVSEIVDALRAEGLRVGFYHSVIDWHHDQYAYALSKQLPHPLRGQPYPNGQRDHAKYVEYLHHEVDVDAGAHRHTDHGAAIEPAAQVCPAVANVGRVGRQGVHREVESEGELAEALPVHRGDGEGLQEGGERDRQREHHHERAQPAVAGQAPGERRATQEQCNA